MNSVPGEVNPTRDNRLLDLNPSQPVEGFVLWSEGTDQNTSGLMVHRATARNRVVSLKLNTAPQKAAFEPIMTDAYSSWSRGFPSGPT